ncbi:S41 family peptidase [Acetobacter conturbans]|uniref:S41 family peptidase n=1 Tax=Acetobacter conturbans TaxID=1737472 RepID=UPI0038D116E4
MLLFAVTLWLFSATVAACATPVSDEEQESAAHSRARLPQTAPQDGLNEAKVAEATPNLPLLYSVIQTGLEFLEPRTLQPYSARQLCLWGLGGISALDPSLRITEAADGIHLMQGQTSVLQRPAPPESSTHDWSSLTTGFLSTAWGLSSVLRAAGEQGVTQSFFDELFNHLDPYSRYVGPMPAETDRTARTGGAAGIGISLEEEISQSDSGRRKRKGEVVRHLIVSAVNTNGPAWPAGVDVGERLVAVDGHSVVGLTVGQVQTLLSGDPGSEVSVRFYSPGTRRTRTVSMRRASVPAETVFAFSAGSLVIIRMTSFSSETAEEMSQYLDQATQDRHLRGIVIDVRGNRGGVLQQAVTAAALLLDNGVAAITKGRDSQANHVWAVQGGDMTNRLPVVILVDGRTASAAEILAAALADHRRAVIVGSATLGKGLVQTVAQLPDRGELFVTWSRVIAPLGWPIQGLGVMPQLCTSRGSLDAQRQMEELKGGHAPAGSSVAESRNVRFPVPVSRILEIRRTCPAALGSDLDLETARDLIENPAAYKAALSMIPDDAEVAAVSSSE